MVYVAVEMSADCSKACSFCCAPNHGSGDNEAILKIIKEMSQEVVIQEIYISSDGELGLIENWPEVYETVSELSQNISILTADPRTVMRLENFFKVGKKPIRVEISLNDHTWLDAIYLSQMCREMDLTFGFNMVDDGKKILDLPQICQTMGADFTYTRQLRSQGRSKKTAGKCSWHNHTGKNLGYFPNNAYTGFSDKPVICVNNMGEIVDYLGQQNLAVPVST